MIVVAELSSVWLQCLPQKPWFYDIWQTWVGYPFQVSSLASGQWPPGIPGISPLEGIIHSSLFPPHGHHLKRCSTRASCLFFGKCCWLLRDFPGTCLGCSSPFQADQRDFHPPRDTSYSQEMLSVFPVSVRTPALLQAWWCFKALLF